MSEANGMEESAVLLPYLLRALRFMGCAFRTEWCHPPSGELIHFISLCRNEKITEVIAFIIGIVFKRNAAYTRHGTVAFVKKGGNYYHCPINVKYNIHHTSYHKQHIFVGSGVYRYGL
jgi:hypothetical protein